MGASSLLDQGPAREGPGVAKGTHRIQPYRTTWKGGPSVLQSVSPTYAAPLLTVQEPLPRPGRPPHRWLSPGSGAHSPFVLTSLFLILALAREPSVKRG